MKSTKTIAINLTRTILLVLGILVAILLTLTSGLIGEVPTLTSGFPDLLAFADQGETTEIDSLQLIRQFVKAGVNIFQHISELIHSN